MIYRANCKLNLHLKITGKRADGYHNLESIFTEIPFYDELEIEKRTDEQILFEEKGLKIPPCAENICITAAKLLKDKAGVKAGCSIVLYKNIPTGAGLGGGSADAATVLKVLNKLWNIHFSLEELMAIATKVGADVPFFLTGQTAWVTGIGEILKPLNNPLKDGYLVLINNGTHISTKDAYKNLKKVLTNAEFRVKFSSLFDSRSAEWNYKLFENDFEDFAFRQFPELREIKNLLYEKGAYLAGMTGSGSTIFGCFTSENDISWSENEESDKFTKIIKVSGGSCGNY